MTIRIPALDDAKLFASGAVSLLSNTAARLAALDAAARVKAGDAVGSKDWITGEAVIDLATEFEAWLLKARDAGSVGDEVGWREVGSVIAGHVYGEEGPVAKGGGGSSACLDAAKELLERFEIRERC